MLTTTEIKNTRNELQENYKRLGYSDEKICADTQMTPEELHRVLDMNKPYPGNVWKLRDYLEDMLAREERELYPFSRLADHKANLWYFYDTPWRTK